jgi:hypothetical protein
MISKKSKGGDCILFQATVNSQLHEPEERHQHREPGEQVRVAPNMSRVQIYNPKIPYN